jgi:hypothetical protein
MKSSNPTQRSGEDFAAQLKGTLKKRNQKVRPPPKIGRVVNISEAGPPHFCKALSWEPCLPHNVELNFGLYIDPQYSALQKGHYKEMTVSDWPVVNNWPRY